MALDDARRATPVVATALALALAFALVASGWSASTQALSRLRIVESFALFDGICLFVLAVAYEVLRLATALEDRKRRPAAPRVVATPFWPAILLVLVLPGTIRYAPRLLEAAWWAAVVLAVGSSVAFTWCLFEDWLTSRASRRRLLWGWLGGVGALLTALVLVSALLPPTAAAWSQAAREAGFVLLPRLFTMAGV